MQQSCVYYDYAVWVVGSVLLVFLCVRCVRVGDQLKQGIGVTHKLFLYKQSLFVISLNEKLFVRDKHGSFLFIFQEGHSVTHRSVFVLVFEYVQCVGRLWVIVSYVPYVFLVPLLHISASLSNIRMHGTMNIKKNYINMLFHSRSTEH